MTQEIQPLSPQEVDARELYALEGDAHLGAGLPLMERRWLATVRDRERQRDDAHCTIQELRALNVKPGISLGLVEQVIAERDELQRTLEQRPLESARHSDEAWERKCDELQRQLAEARKDMEIVEWLQEHAQSIFVDGDEMWCRAEDDAISIRAILAARIAQGQEGVQSE